MEEKSPDFVALDDPLLAQLAQRIGDAAATEDQQRVLRISVEAMRSFRSLAGLRRAVSIFGSARVDLDPDWMSLAERTARLLSRAGFSVITGGGPGLMEAANAGGHAGGGGSVGLTIHLPLLGEPLNAHVLEPVPFHYFFLRKLAFVKYSCAFVCLPGGFGTLDELFEALNLKRTGRIEPFPVILLGSEYWTGLLEWLRKTSVKEGTLNDDDLELIEVMDDPEAVVERVRSAHAELCLELGLSPKDPQQTTP